MANETILVIDADPKSQKVLEVSFKKAGYRVQISESLAQAREQLLGEHASLPDLIIADASMPEGDAFELCRELKERGVLDRAPLLFLTEDDSLERKMRGFKAGASDYLTKPIYIREVTSRVELLLQRRATDPLRDEESEQVEGSLDDVTMIDLLQTIESSDRDGTLYLEREGHQASVYFREGNILDAVCGKLKGEEAIFRMMLWPKGHFTLRYHAQTRRADHIEKVSDELLIEGMRRFDRWNEMVKTMPHLGSVFEADMTRMGSMLAGWPDEVGRIVRLFDGYHTLRDVIDDSPLDDLTTLRIIRKLLDTEILRDATPQDASLRETTQHTNLASWLSSRPIRSATREEASRLFDTTPGFKSVPGLNADSSVESPEEIEAVARTLDEISSQEEIVAPVTSPFPGMRRAKDDEPPEGRTTRVIDAAGGEPQ